MERGTIIDGKIIFRKGLKASQVLKQCCPICPNSHACQIFTKEGYAYLSPSMGDHQTVKNAQETAVCLQGEREN